MSIPKIIHYCWFGGAPLDDMAIRCIESWKRYFPDYEIIQWNEDNFDISSCEFMQKAYEDKKWAFVSDVARLKVVYEYGGIYFDTDVEVVAPYDDILSTEVEGFLGIESTLCVATGLGFGAEKHNRLLKDLISLYDEVVYDAYKGNLSEIACTILTTELLKQHGFVSEDKYQKVCGFDIYPTAYFSPIDYNTGKLQKKAETHSIHWYGASWLSEKEKVDIRKMQKLASVVGKTAADHIWGIVSCISKEGLWAYLQRRINKYLLKK